MNSPHNTPQSNNETKHFYLPFADKKLFCAWKVTYNPTEKKFDKMPYDSNGVGGISVEDSHRLDTANTVRKFLRTKGKDAFTCSQDKSGWFPGFSFYEPIMVGEQYLVCVDIDLDDGLNEQATSDVQMVIKALMKNGNYYERSVSGRGYHFFVLCDKEKIPKTYISKDGWRVEVFSGISSQRKLLCLTNHEVGGNLQSEDLQLLFKRQGLNSELVVNDDESLYPQEGFETPSSEPEKVDMDDPTLNIKPWTKDAIRNGYSTTKEGVVNHDRSVVIHGVIKDLIRAGLKDGQIIYLLTDKQFEISTKALEKGGPKRAREWIAKQIPKHRLEVQSESHEQSADVFDEETSVTIDSTTGEIIKVTAQCQPECYPFLVDPKAFNGLPTLKSSGKYLASPLALLAVIKRMPIYFDTFQGVPIFRNHQNGKWERFTDSTYVHIAAALDYLNFSTPSMDLLKSTVRAVCESRPIDTAVEWANSIEWDGIERCKKLFTEYFGAEDNELSRAASMYIAASMGARVLNTPLAITDMVVTLVGEQGTGKSTAIRALAPQLAQHMEVNLSDKEADIARKSLGKLVAELAELQGLKTRSAEHIKAWMSRSVDEWVPKFKEFTVASNRRFVLIATTNEDEFLTDTTGNRRWIVLHIESQSSVERIKEDMEQIWAEAVHIFKKDGLYKHYSAAKALAGKENHNNLHTNDTELEAVKDYIDTYEVNRYESVKAGNKPNPLKLANVVNYVYPNYTGSKARFEVSVARCLGKLGYEKKHTKYGNVWVKQSE